jgi:23S rRNA-/tRNA-specific pseudouridylate synthase
LNTLQSLKWLVPESQKLISFIQAQIDPPPSRKALRRVLEARLCRVNGIVERFGSMDVQKGSVVELGPSWASVLSPHCSQFEVLYEEEHLLVVDKPVGFVCSEQTMGSGHHLVHRLDKETTGVLVLAKTTVAKNDLMRRFKERSVEKFYYALVDGAPSQERGVCKSFLAKLQAYQGQTRWGSRARGLPAETHWAVLWRGKNASLLLCRPTTGRTHQIRVHLAEMGHPILGDRQYAKNFRCQLFAQRPFLHAARIRFGDVDVSAPLPFDFASALQELECHLGIS